MRVVIVLGAKPTAEPVESSTDVVVELPPGGVVVEPPPLDVVVEPTPGDVVVELTPGGVVVELTTVVVEGVLAEISVKTQYGTTFIYCQNSTNIIF